MKILVEQEKLAKALNNVSRVAAGARATLPILNNTLIRVNDGKVSFTTTNLDMATVSYFTVDKYENGVVTVPARLMAEFVSNLPRGEIVEITVENGEKIITKAGGYNSVINGTSAEEFPELPEIDQEKAVKFVVDAELFKTGMAQVMVAASSDMTRPALTGVYFNTYEEGLYLAATDGYRLAERRLIKEIGEDVTAIVPASSLQEVMRALNDAEDEIEILFDETQVKFRLSEVEITSKLVDGSFPDYRQLIPKESDIKVELKRDELMRITKLAALFAKEVGGSIICATDVDLGVFRVASVANEFGENSSQLETEVEASGSVTLNSRFLLDALNAVGGKEVTFGFSNRLDPVVVRDENSTDYVHIVMPLKS